jgi:hypothetical protein
MALEPRMMFDGAALATVASDHHTDSPSPDADAAPLGDVVAIGAAEPAPSRREVAFVDASVTNWQDLVAGIGAGIEIVVLDAGGDSLSAMAEWASTHSDYDAIHILSHGSDGALNLGAVTLDADAIATRQADLAVIGQALGADGDILVYGCYVARGADGMDLVGTLAQATGADVAASDDGTGTEGDWTLEVSSGVIETAGLVIAGFDGTLAAPASQDFTAETTGGATSTLTKSGVVYSLNGSGVVNLNADAGGYVAVDAFTGLSGKGIVANYDLTSDGTAITTFTIASTDLANSNFKLTSLVLGVGNSNFGTYTIAGYDGGIAGTKQLSFHGA